MRLSYEVDNDNDDDGKGGSQGKSINDSISERKCIVTMIVTLFRLSLIIIPINNIV
jgi:hypothetical protein